MAKDIDSQINDSVNDFRKFSIDCMNEVDKAILQAALKVEADAKVNEREFVDTGRLMGSITHRLGKDNESTYAEVGTNVDYGMYQEFGTSKMKPQPFLTPAFETNKVAIQEYIARAVKKAADDAGR